MDKHCSMEGCNNPKRSKGLCNAHYLRLLRYGDPNIKKKEFKKKIVFRVNKDGCFECTSYKPGVNGYPQVRYKGIPSPAHRQIYEECFGEIPKGLVVRHKCDNRLCINPEHLELGTIRDNINDCIERKRNAIGENVGSSKLKNNEVFMIKREFKNRKANVHLISSLSTKYGVAPQTIYDIYYGVTWKHIEV